MKTKIIKIMLIFAMLLSFMPLIASAYLTTGTCGANVEWGYNMTGLGDELDIWGEGDMESYDYTNYNQMQQRWGKMHQYVTKVTIDEGVTSVGDAAFWGCTKLETVILPGSVKKIGTHSFEQTNIKEINLQEGTEEIDASAFFMTPLTDLTIPSTLKTISVYSFSQLSTSGLNVHISDIGAWCNIINANGFDSTKGYPINLYINDKPATSVTIPDGTRIINGYTFYDFTNVTDITIPESVTYIGSNAFNKNTTLYVYKDSAAHEYAEKNTIPYELITYVSPTPTPFVKPDTEGNKISISNSIINGDTLRFTAGLSTNNKIQGTIFTAIYDSEGKLTNVKSCDATASTDITVAKPDDDGNVKVFWWYDANSMYPMAEHADVKWSDVSWSLDDSGVLTVSGKGDMEDYNSTQVPWDKSKITSVIIGEGITSIGKQAFSDCVNLKSVTIANSVTSIGDSAFKGCDKIEEITLPFVGSSREASGTYDAVFGYIFGYNSSYESGTTRQYYDETVSKDCYYYYIPSSLKKVTLTDATQIPSGAFYGCKNLTEINLSGNIASVANGAFYGCSNLTYAEVPNSVTTIGSSAFEGCDSLEEIALPFVGSSREASGTYDAVLGYVFGYTTSSNSSGTTQQYYSASSSHYYFIPESLKKVTITDSEQIPYGSFYNCINISDIWISDSVTSIGDKAFYNTAFYNNIEDWEDGVLYAGRHLIKADKDTVASVCSIKEDTITIMQEAFKDCTGITEIVIPDSVTSIGESVFSGCNSLEEITLPFVGSSRNASGYEAVFGYIFGYTTHKSISWSDPPTDKIYQYTEKDWNITNGFYTIDYYYNIPKGIEKIEIISTIQIPYHAFYNCSSLTSITIPDSVTSIGDGAFYNCSSLTSITIPDGVTSISDSTFYNCSSLTSITIPNGVTGIGQYAFYHCSSLTSLTIPDSVTSIENYAFSYCSALTSIVIPDSVTSIGEGAFRVCNKLEEITLPFVGSSRDASETSDAVFGYIFGYSSTGTKQYYKDGYYYSNNYYIPTTIKKVEITDATQIPYGAFYNCGRLESIIISDSVTSIGDNAFYNCSALTSITIPDGVTSIGDSAFYDCSNLEEVHITDLEAYLNINFSSNNNPMTYANKLYLNGELIAGDLEIPDGVTKIPYRAFSGCVDITGVIIPDSVTSIGEYAFDACENLQTVYYTGNRIAWDNINIGSYNNYLTNAEIVYNYLPE